MKQKFSQSTKQRFMFDPIQSKMQMKQLSSFKSSRKPIFQNSPYYSRKKKVQRSISIQEPTNIHIQFQTVNDDFCGCDHILEPCAIIKQLLVGISQKSMREQYESLEKASIYKCPFELRRKYFRLLPAYYPELYHAQLTNILTNIQEEITLNEFVTLAWIEYHAKYEHITCFLFTDLRKAQKPKKKFFDQLELLLITKEVDFNSLIREAKVANLPLVAFLESYHESFAANIIPLSQYAKFIKILLKKGQKALKMLLLQMLTSKKQTLFELLKYFASGQQFRQKSRALLWQQYLQNLLSENEA